MHVLIVSTVKIPVTTYGGTERIAWGLGKELNRLGHRVSFLVNQGSQCPFARVIFIDPTKALHLQVPDDVDVVHFFYAETNFKQKPYISTIHTNPPPQVNLDENSVFVSANHAERMGSTVFVRNGIDLADYPLPDLSKKRIHTHYLAKAAWRLKNVKGAISIATKSDNKLIVMGGDRLNIKMGFRFTPNLNVRFKGMVDNEVKSAVMNSSKALLFPVLWHEPFGIAIIESLYFGCPVIGTPYGALPEIVTPEYGVLSASQSVLIEGLKGIDRFDNRACHDYAADNFNITKMTVEYIKLYERVMNGQKLSEVKPKISTEPQPKFLPWNE